MQMFVRTFGPRKPKTASPARRSRPLDVSEREWRQLRARVFARDGFACVYCTDMPPRQQLQADHVIPRSRGGPSTFENLATACGPCNLDKSDRTPEEWRAAHG